MSSFYDPLLAIDATITKSIVNDSSTNSQSKKRKTTNTSNKRKKQSNNQTDAANIVNESSSQQDKKSNSNVQLPNDSLINETPTKKQKKGQSKSKKKDLNNQDENNENAENEQSNVATANKKSTQRPQIYFDPILKSLVDSNSDSFYSSQISDGLFTKELSFIMFGSGDVKHPLPETLSLMDSLLVTYLSSLISDSSRVSRSFALRAPLRMDLLLMTIKNRQFLNRITNLTNS